MRRGVVAAAKKPQAPRKRQPKRQPTTLREPPLLADDEDDEDFAPPPQSPEVASGRLPQAPPPGSSKKKDESASNVGPDGLPYPVFLPKSRNVKEMGGSGRWSWTDDGNDVGVSNEPPLPEWNPQTGFMASRSLDPSAGSSSSSGSGFGASSKSRARSGSPQPVASPGLQQGAQLGSVDASKGEGVQGSNTVDLPYVPKNAIMTSCLGTSFTMGILALFLRAYALANAPRVLGTDQLLLAEFAGRFPTGLGSWTNLGILVGATTIVTGLRFTLLRVWPEFRQASERSNKQILAPLNWFDIAVVASLTGLSEELLFRGAIIPGSFIDWRGVLLSGVIFGALHNSSGRNPAFAAWASGVGCLYGTSFLITHNIWVPAVAHATSNFISAAVWKWRNTN